MRSSGSERTLVIMAKAPRPGVVKTRLAPSLSPEAVTDFYCCLLEDTLALARSLREVEVAIMCPESDVNELVRLAGNAVTVTAQNGEGLAAGLTSVYACFTADRRRVIAFNSDSPHLPASVLQDAFETLTTHDVVVGPTHDGGYYLVGAKASHPTLFANDGMGTSSALERLLSRARSLELSVGFAKAFYDIDVADDLTRLAEELKVAPAKAPRTAEWLKEWEHKMAFPSDANGDALRRMRAQGDDLTRPRNIEYAVIFPNQDSAHKFAHYIGALGYESSLESSETVPGLPWEVIVMKHMVPSHNEIEEFEAVLEMAARPLGGRNDGWGCFSEPSGEP